MNVPPKRAVRARRDGNHKNDVRSTILLSRDHEQV